MDPDFVDFNDYEDDIPPQQTKSSNQNFMSSWFYKIFGFDETNDINYCKSKIIQKMNNFKIVSNGSLFDELVLLNKGKVTFDNIVISTKELYSNKVMSTNAIFQVETNADFKNNEHDQCIKLADYTNEQMKYTPHESAHLIYELNNADTLDSFFNYVKTYDNTIQYEIQNGVLMFPNSDELAKVKSVLMYSTTRRRDARRKLQNLYYKFCTTIIDNIKINNNICQVYCYALPINVQNYDNDLWKGLVELFLEAMYENTLYIANKYNEENNCNATCYLVSLGEQYGISSAQVARAIQRACQIASSKNIKLDVKLVHKVHNYDNCYDELSKSYPLNHVDVASVWDS